jgi:hypothetical protein
MAENEKPRKRSRTRDIAVPPTGQAVIPEEAFLECEPPPTIHPRRRLPVVPAKPTEPQPGEEKDGRQE